MWGQLLLPLLLLLLRAEPGLCDEPGCNNQTVIFGIEGESIALSPVVNGNPEDIVWKKKKDIVADWSKQAISTNFVKDSVKYELSSYNLVIKNLSQNDSGMYKAEPRIKLEFQYIDFCLKVLSAPPPPPDLSCTVNNGSIQVKCTPVAQDLPLAIPSYHWKYKEMEEINSEQFVVPLGKNTDSSEEITCSIIFANINASGSITLSECLPRDSDHQTTETRSHLLVVILVSILIVAVIMILLWKKGAFKGIGTRIPCLAVRSEISKDIQEKERSPLNEGGPVESEGQNNSEDVSEGPGPSPEEGSVPVNGPKSDLNSSENLEENNREGISKAES